MPFFSRKGDPIQNPYDLLEIKHGATDDEISKAFKKLMFALHPDKQPPGQSPEEAAMIAQKLHDVMDAKSFLLDGEYLTARREYDANLVKVAMQPPTIKVVHNDTAQMPVHKAAVAAPEVPAAAPGLFRAKNTPQMNDIAAGNTNLQNMEQRPDNLGMAGNNIHKTGVKFKADPLPKGKVNIKQWGKAKKTDRSRGRSCPADSRQNVSSGDVASDEPVKNKNYYHTQMNGNDYYVEKTNGFNESNGECSTTDECGSNSDDGFNNTRRQNQDTRRRRKTVDDSDSNDCGELHRVKSNPPVNSHGHGIRRHHHHHHHHQQHTHIKPSTAPNNISDKRRSRSDEGVSVGKVVGNNNGVTAHHHTKRRSETNNTDTNHDAVEERYDSLREAVDIFIKDLSRKSQSSTSAQPSTVSIPPLDMSDATSFSFLGLLFHLEVPNGVGSDKIMVQTWYTHRKNSTQISSLVAQFNARLQKADTGCRVTFRNMNGKYAFTLTKKANAEHFSKKGLRHCIEYFIEMSIKLHNLINPMDVKKLDRVRLTS